MPTLNRTLACICSITGDVEAALPPYNAEGSYICPHVPLDLPIATNVARACGSTLSGDTRWVATGLAVSRPVELDVLCMCICNTLHPVISVSLQAWPEIQQNVHAGGSYTACGVAASW